MSGDHRGCLGTCLGNIGNGDIRAGQHLRRALELEELGECLLEYKGM